MAGIVGIYCADGRPADTAELRAMAEAEQRRAHDGITYWDQGPVAFAHLQFHTTPESLDERQPLTTPGGETCVVWNGRLDNREDLRAALAEHNAYPIDTTDPGYALSAYLAWGADCVQRMVGDFAFAVWDARNRKLWCARDYLGIKPFYYFWDGRTFLFGSGVCGLLAHSSPSLAINEAMVGEYLANEVTSREETFYRDIRRLPPGSTLTIGSAGNLKISTWWRPELSPIHYHTDEEYAEHFRELLITSVRSRMRVHGGLVSTLSGGLDSSTISVTAQEILNAQGFGARVSTLSFVAPGKDWDESEYIRETASLTGLETDMTEAATPDLEFFRSQATLWRDIPSQPNGAAPSLVPFVSHPQGHAQVLLAGVGGNEWLDGTPANPRALLRLIAHRHFAAAMDEWRMDNRLRDFPLWLAQQWLKPVVPDSILRRKRARSFAQRDIFSDDFLRRTHLLDRIYTAPEQIQRADRNLPFTTLDQRDVFHRVTSGWEAFVLETNDRETAGLGIEQRFPLLDRRLGEFCLRLPRSQRQRGEVWKWVLRSAMSGHLPARVLDRMVQAEFSQLFEAVLSAPPVQHRMQNLSLLRQTDWLDPRRFSRHTRLTPNSHETDPLTYRRAWNAFAVDLWFEALCK